MYVNGYFKKPTLESSAENLTRWLDMKMNMKDDITILEHGKG